MNFIKKIFDGETDESVHLQFQKFSRGEFRDRALIKAKQSKSKYNIATTSEFANELVKIIAEKLKDTETRVTGCIVSTSDLTNDLEFKDKKQFQGVKRYIIDKEMSGERIIGLLKKFPKAFFALSFESDDTKIKIKAKTPKSGKPGSKGSKKPNPDFCKLTTSDSELGESFVFEKPNFKLAEITHHFIIEEIILPELEEGEKDYAKIRGMAKRKGKIIREAIIDEKEINSEKEFIA